MATPQTPDVAEHIAILKKHFEAIEAYYTLSEAFTSRQTNNDASWRISRAIRLGITDAVSNGGCHELGSEREKETLRSFILSSIVNDKTVALNGGLPRHLFTALSTSFQKLVDRTQAPVTQGAHDSASRTPIDPGNEVAPAVFNTAPPGLQESPIKLENERTVNSAGQIADLLIATAAPAYFAKETQTFGPGSVVELEGPTAIASPTGLAVDGISPEEDEDIAYLVFKHTCIKEQEKEVTRRLDLVDWKLEMLKQQDEPIVGRSSLDHKEDRTVDMGADRVCEVLAYRAEQFISTKEDEENIEKEGSPESREVHRCTSYEIPLNFTSQHEGNLLHNTEDLIEVVIENEADFDKGDPNAPDRDGTYSNGKEKEILNILDAARGKVEDDPADSGDEEDTKVELSAEVEDVIENNPIHQGDKSISHDTLETASIKESDHAKTITFVKKNEQAIIITLKIVNQATVNVLEAMPEQKFFEIVFQTFRDLLPDWNNKVNVGYTKLLDCGDIELTASSDDSYALSALAKLASWAPDIERKLYTKAETYEVNISAMSIDAVDLRDRRHKVRSIAGFVKQITGRTWYYLDPQIITDIAYISPRLAHKKSDLWMRFASRPHANSTMIHGLGWRGNCYSAWPLHIPLATCRCSKCQAYGHEAPACVSSVRCGKCAGPHNTQVCKSKRRQCVSCGSEAASGHAKCPAKIAARSQVRFGNPGPQPRAESHSGRLLEVESEVKSKPESVRKPAPNSASPPGQSKASRKEGQRRGREQSKPSKADQKATKTVGTQAAPIPPTQPVNSTHPALQNNQNSKMGTCGNCNHSEISKTKSEKQIPQRPIIINQSTTYDGNSNPTTFARNENRSRQPSPYIDTRSAMNTGPDLPVPTEPAAMRAMTYDPVAILRQLDDLKNVVKAQQAISHPTTTHGHPAYDPVPFRAPFAQPTSTAVPAPKKELNKRSASEAFMSGAIPHNARDEKCIKRTPQAWALEAIKSSGPKSLRH